MRLRAVALILLVAAGWVAVRSFEGSGGQARAREAPARIAGAAAAGTHRSEYVFVGSTMYVYDIDHLASPPQAVPLPGVSGIRGVAASPATHRLFISFGGDKGREWTGSLLSLDLLTNRVLWRQDYSRGIDSMAVDSAGRFIYMPDGELSPDGVWSVIDASNGSVVGTIDGGLGPHNTVIGPSGRWIYLGGRNYNYLDVASTAGRTVVRRVGPLIGGVRPFTVDGREDLAYTTATRFLGFQVSSLRNGRVLYTMRFGSRFGYDPGTFPATAPSHGIALSPASRQVWVVDGPNSYVHVFDVRRVPRHPPRRIADLRLRHSFSGTEDGCAYDCNRDGWLQRSTDGCLMFVTDSGDVFSTRSRRIVGFLPQLRNTRTALEIDWRNGMPTATSTRTGVGSPSGARARCP
jgi:DNA-binding beta-propeller fold protein YncE